MPGKRRWPARIARRRPFSYGGVQWEGGVTESVPSVMDGNAEPMGTTYSFRSNAFVGERTYRLTDDALVVEEVGKPLGGAFFDGISEVRLAFAPTRAATHRYRAQIVYRAGGMAELFNLHYRGIMDFPEKNAEYTAFLTELHRRLAAKGKDVRYRAGNSVGGYIGNWALTIFIFAMLALVIFFLIPNWGGTWIVFAKLVVILFFIPVLITYMRKAKPRTYDPLAIPADVLPDR